MGPLCHSRISFLLAPSLAPFHPTYMTVRNACKASVSAQTLAVEFKIDAFSASFIAHRSHLLILDLLPSLALPLYLAYALCNHPRCKTGSFPLSIKC